MSDGRETSLRRFQLFVGLSDFAENVLNKEFDRIRIDHLRPFPFEQLIFLVGDRRHTPIGFVSVNWLAWWTLKSTIFSIIGAAGRVMSNVKNWTIRWTRDIARVTSPKNGEFDDFCTPVERFCSSIWIQTDGLISAPGRSRSWMTRTITCHSVIW